MKYSSTRSLFIYSGLLCALVISLTACNAMQANQVVPNADIAAPPQTQTAGHGPWRTCGPTNPC